MLKTNIIITVIVCILLLPQVTSASVIHVVKKGESLWGISNIYGTSVEEIVNSNGLPYKDVITPGLPLLISGNQYIVQAGEGIWEIAQRHSTSIEKIKSANDLEKNNLYPNQKLTIPSTPKKEIFTGAFMVPAGKKASKSLLKHYKKLISTVGFFEYHPDSQGNLSKMPGEATVKTAWKNNLIPYATITNLSSNGFDDELAHQVIGNKETRGKLINNIYAVLHENDYKGAIIDFEGIKNNDRENFNQFIKELTAKLHPIGMKVNVTLPPMQGDRYPDYYSGYDYKTLGKTVDSMFLMTYDWHWSGGPAGAIAPLGKVRETIEYAISAVPRSKIILGIPMYAYDWNIDNKEQNGSAYAQENAIKLALDHGSVIHYNKETHQPWFRYKDKNGDRHEVWFEDARSILAKYRLVKDYNLYGMGGWKMGLSFPQAEQLLRKEFKLRQ
ncbi:glycosyl hydrolase family 18 protein [Virgibacillus sp. L01]|uniref:glycosyl hydrolase family 18 protein n=1 Tax=Virgibacillus sp. L01 TaxID=3457429 RepID=UPI003FD5A1BC